MEFELVNPPRERDGLFDPEPTSAISLVGVCTLASETELHFIHRSCWVLAQCATQHKPIKNWYNFSSVCGGHHTLSKKFAST